MTKIANTILYMLHKKVKHLNDKKVAILLFLIDYNHQKFCGNKIFNEKYIKNSRHPHPLIIGELFDIVANNQGKRELKLLIKSKLADLELETGFKVTSNIENLIHKIEGAYIVDETDTTNK